MSKEDAKIIDSAPMTFYCAPSPTPGPDDLLAWEPYMHEALKLAHLAEGRGDVPVGAVVIDGSGQILGRGENRTIFENDPTAHAEILALREACAKVGNHRLTDAVLVVTLEPCIMCLGAVIQARLAGVVYAAADPKAGCLVSRMDGTALPWSNHHFWSLGGVLEQECSAKLSGFFKQRRQEKKISKNLAER
ncbi:tRNA-adenosine deaminase [Desulfomicrobium apsheronum]|uniref:tRNA-specific adenosine deaminase n=1 Tax=Desulfomicrobium apsheronum TaxID=52560 RepID=A0A1I3TXI1_9BACT|nr:tRNA adenosine(34) deaminase TadA [Desulfomicrobium apsheronum]SFJ74237.1 tRNA-adenosine deaminase [Desulfomicrobium apsheronum]